ncbi:MAG: ComEC/Rec2-related protein:DNA internalization-related competence protein ComEC/Rec2 [Proteobacteria bacterium]|nr:ComEC/Rec2-related protein:DNA internalization-related competence protein ComEC/Rec2 [Pseudomonadota bacterium]
MRTNILAFAAGIVWLQFQAELPSWWGLALAFGIALALLSWRLRVWKAGRILGVVACVLLGLGFATWRAELRLADQLPSVWEGKDVELVGVVAELPQDFGQGMRFRFAVEEVKTAGAIIPRQIMLSWYSGQRDCANCKELVGRKVKPGERWRLTVRLKRPHGSANPHAFDYEAWLLERGIRATGYVRPGEKAERLAEMVWTPGNAVERLRHAVRDSFQTMLPEARYPYAGVLVALVVGDQRAINGELWNTFNRTGITHLMSISGSHITMIAALVALMTGWAWRRIPFLALRCPTRRAAIMAGFLAALFYTLIAGFAVPAQRTLYMLAVAALALYSGRRLAASRVLCLALLAVLLIDPWAVLSAGFWLSFGAVGALLFVGAALVGSERGWRQYFKAWGGVQWAATLSSLPVLLLIFQQFSLVSPLANAVAIPLVGFVITPLALTAAILPWQPLLELAHALLALLISGLQWCATLPVWQAAAPPLWTALAAAVGVVLLLLPRGLAGRAAGIALLLPLFFWPPPRPLADEAWIDVLDVGQGLAVLVRTRQHNLLFDTGPRYSAESDAGQRVIVPYLRALGINRLDVLMLSHRDMDHSGGAAAVRAAVAVDQRYASFPEPGATLCQAGQGWQWDGVRFEVLHPVVADAADNNVSCVLRVETAGRAMLLLADTEARDEASMLVRDPKPLRADVMLVPHHGSKTSSSEAFLAAVGVREAIISAGYRNRFGHPKGEILARYQARGARVWRTDTQGTILVHLAPNRVDVSAWRELKKRYWIMRY